MSKHTPGPWTFTSEQISDDGVQIHDEIRCFHLQSGDTVVLDGCGCCDSPRLGNPADARLIAAAPDLLQAWTTGSEINTPDFMDWIADRLVNVYGENPNIDFVQSLRYRAKLARAAIAKAKGEV